MASVKIVPGGGLILIKLDKEDFKASYREFLDRLKTVDGWEYDDEVKEWTLPESAFDAVCEWKRELLTLTDPNQESMF